MSERAGWGRLWGQKVCADKGSDLVLVNPGGGHLLPSSAQLSPPFKPVSFSQMHTFSQGLEDFSNLSPILFSHVSPPPPLSLFTSFSPLRSHLKMAVVVTANNPSTWDTGVGALLA